MITCPTCGDVVQTIDWSSHKMLHSRPVVQSSMQFPKKVIKAAERLTDTISRAGGGSISINGEEIVSIPKKDE